MKKRIGIGITFAVIFIAALITFSLILNRNSDEKTADMGGVSLPVLSFQEGDYKINELPGYAKSMEITTIRDVVYPLKVGTSVTANISGYTGKIHSAVYEVCTPDGKKVVKKDEIKNIKDAINMELGSSISDGKEKMLKIRLKLDEDRNAYYYTRVVRAAEFNVEQCLKFAEDFHNKTFIKEETAGLKQYLSKEKTETGNSLQNVTLSSDLEQIGWGGLAPEVEGDIRWQIKESNETYTSISLKYQVKSGEDVYLVTEFLKVRFLKGKASLEDYNRTMNQVFSVSKKNFGRKGITLGITDENIPYLVSSSGDVLSFVQEREVWNYNKKKNQITLVFSFADAENQDVRNDYDSHSVRLLDMDEQGNTTFAVYGYMNRGVNEGQVGTAVYHFYSENHYVEEKAFIPTRQSSEMIMQNTDQLVCYDQKGNRLYILPDGTLYEVDLETQEKKALAEDLKEGQYMTSEDGKYLAYQSRGTAPDSESMTVWNMDTGKNYQIEAGEGEIVRPLGFVLGDIVYGIGRKSDIGKNISGETILPLYKLEIRNEKQEVAKTYQMEQTYIVGTTVADNMLTLERVQRNGDVYKNISPDYITNNKEQVKSTVKIETYLDAEIGAMQVRLADEKGSGKEPELLKTKQKLGETFTADTFQFEEEHGYYVYGRGKLQGIYAKAGEAIQAADLVKGVVVTSGQTKIWERGNRMLRYNLAEAKAFAVKPGESTLEACLRQILAYEGKSADVTKEMANGKSALDILNEYSGGEAVDLSGCTAEQLFYIIGKGTPVIAVTGGQRAILLTGYDDTTITYLNPQTGRKPTEPIRAIEKMAEAGGGTFIGYVR